MVGRSSDESVAFLAGGSIGHRSVRLFVLLFAAVFFNAIRTQRFSAISGSVSHAFYVEERRFNRDMKWLNPDVAPLNLDCHKWSGDLRSSRSSEVVHCISPNESGLGDHDSATQTQFLRHLSPQKITSAKTLPWYRCAPNNMRERSTMHSLHLLIL